MESKHDSSRTLKENMLPIPFDFGAQRRAEVYLYYFTAEEFRKKESKYRLLDESLCIFGRHRGNVEVVMMDKDRISTKAWNAILRGLGIKKYPALVVSSNSLGIELLEAHATEYNPPRVEFEKWEGERLAQTVEEMGELNFLNMLLERYKKDDYHSP